MTIDHTREPNSALYSKWQFTNITEWNQYLNSYQRTQLLVTEQYTIGQESVSIAETTVTPTLIRDRNKSVGKRILGGPVAYGDS